MLEIWFWIAPFLTPIVTAFYLKKRRDRYLTLATLIASALFLFAVQNGVDVPYVDRIVLWATPILLPLILAIRQARRAPAARRCANLLMTCTLAASTIIGVAWSAFGTWIVIHHNSQGTYCDLGAPADEHNFHAGNGDCRIIVSAVAPLLSGLFIVMFGLSTSITGIAAMLAVTAQAWSEPRQVR